MMELYFPLGMEDADADSVGLINRLLAECDLRDFMSASGLVRKVAGEFVADILESAELSTLSVLDYIRQGMLKVTWREPYNSYELS